jgi:hypothetical protein
VQRVGATNRENGVAAGDQRRRDPLAGRTLDDGAQGRVGGGRHANVGIAEHGADRITGLQRIDFSVPHRRVRQRAVARDETADHAQERGREKERDLAQRKSGECCAHHMVSVEANGV